MLLERIKLEDDEKVLRIVRKHWWIIFTRTASTAFFIVLPIICVVIAIRAFTDIPIATYLFDSYLKETLFCYSAWLLINWMILANFWTDHYLDLWAITNRRIVAIDQRGFFSRFLSSFRLERLQDMNIEVHGIIPTLLNYGTIEAQTAGGSNEEFETANMPDPRGLKALIIQAADERQNEVGASSIRSDGTL